MTPSQGIDIIIPVYNAFDDLVKCIDSIKAHTDLIWTPWQIQTFWYFTIKITLDFQGI